MERNNINSKLEIHKLPNKAPTKACTLPSTNHTKTRNTILNLFANHANITLFISEVSFLLVPLFAFLLI
jgi:hypothetical protein